jgi:hypothetical protein
LQAAADEWKNKWIHWTQYCSEQHYAYYNPILIVQVQNGTARQISTTDLDDCLRIIEERTGERFAEGQVVHAFGEGTSTLVINGWMFTMLSHPESATISGSRSYSSKKRYRLAGTAQEPKL